MSVTTVRPGELTPEQENRLRDELLYITANPEIHNQGWWATKTACGTAYCLAGNVVVRAGYEVDWRFSLDVKGPDDEALSSYVINEEGTVHIPELAREMLGFQRIAVDPGIARHMDGGRTFPDPDTEELRGEFDLFQGENTIDALWAMARVVSEGRITRPETIETTIPDAVAVETPVSV